MSIGKLLFILMISFSTDAMAKDSVMTTLIDAKNSDPQLKAAVSSKNATIEKLPQARAGILPEVAFQGNYLWNRTDFESLSSLVKPIYDKYHNGTQFSVKLTQPLFDLERLIGYKQGELDVVIAEKQYQKDYQDFLLRVLKAYFDLASALEVQVAAENQLTAIKDQYDLTKKSYDIGVGNITELLEAEAKLSLGKGDLVMAQRDVSIKRQAYHAVVGRYDNGIELYKNIDRFALPTPNNLEAWRQAAKKNSPEVLKRVAAYEKAKMDVNKARAGHLPTVDAVAQHSYRYTEFSAGSFGYTQQDTSLGFEFKVPIFNGLAIQSKTREAKATSEKALEELEYSRRTVDKDVTEAFVNVTEGLTEVTYYQSAVDESLKSVDANRLGYKAGIRSNIDVLNSQQQVLTSSKRLIKAKYDFLYYSMKMKSLVGELDDSYFQELEALTH